MKNYAKETNRKTCTYGKPGAKPVPTSAAKPVNKPVTSAKPNAAAKPMAKPAAKPAPKVGPMVVKMDEEKIRSLAFDFSQEPKSYDDWIWLLAENELRLNKAYTTGSNPLMGTFPESVSIDPKKIIDDPDVEDIKPLAEMFASQFAKFTRTSLVCCRTCFYLQCREGQ